MRRPVIACGIDGSDNALDAARVSGELGRRLGRRVLLVHASPPSAPMRAMTTTGGRPWPRSGYPLVGPEKREAQARLRRAAEAVGAGVRVDTALEVADPVSRLLEVAEREAAEMLVVGSRGRGPGRAIVLGSVSREVAALADRPVLILPAGPRPSA